MFGKILFLLIGSCVTAEHLQCLGHTCKNPVPHCLITMTNGTLHGQCYLHHHLHHLERSLCQNRRFTLNPGESCGCEVQGCIGRVVKAYNANVVCNTVTCAAGEVCLLMKGLHYEQDKISVYTKCRTMPSHPNYCTTHDSLWHGGCICNTTACAETTKRIFEETMSQVLNKNLQCLLERCETPNLVCKIEKYYSNLIGTCEQNPIHMCGNQSHYYLFGGHSSCTCLTQDCISKMIKNNVRNARIGFRCLKSICNENQACHLYKTPQSEQIESKCSATPNPMNLCTNHDSIFHPDGCYCNDTNCMNKVAIHHKRISCTANQGLKVFVIREHVYVRCQDSIGTLPRCDEPFIPSLSKEPCFCSTQSCADNIREHAPTTTTTNSTPTTTSMPTAIKTTTTESAPRIFCNVCGNQESGIPCKSSQLNDNYPISILCPTGENYCMTDIYQDSVGNVDVFKRCVNESVCQNQWLNGSATSTYCVNYGFLKSPGAFQCHFCCDHDGCNKHLVPEKYTWYTHAENEGHF